MNTWLAENVFVLPDMQSDNQESASNAKGTTLTVIALLARETRSGKEISVSVLQEAMMWEVCANKTTKFIL